METMVEMLYQGAPNEITFYGINKARNILYEQYLDYNMRLLLWLGKELINYIRDFENFKKKKDKEKNNSHERLNLKHKK